MNYYNLYDEDGIFITLQSEVETKRRLSKMINDYKHSDPYDYTVEGLCEYLTIFGFLSRVCDVPKVYF